MHAWSIKTIFKQLHSEDTGREKRERERGGGDNAYEFDFGKKQISLFHLAFLFPFKVLKLRDLSYLYQMSNTHFFSLYKGAWVGRKSEWLVLRKNLEEPHSMASLGMSNQSVLFYCDIICICCTVLILVLHLIVILWNAFRAVDLTQGLFWWICVFWGRWIGWRCGRKLLWKNSRQCSTHS